MRLPTICVRPGAPNKAASGFFSGIIREPLNGKEALLPVGDDVRHWHASPRAAVGFLMHAAELDLSLLGPRRALTMPGVAVTVAEQIEALRAVGRRQGGGADPPRAGRDDRAASSPAGRAISTRARAKSLGFHADANFSAIINAYIEDELKG